jgi:hypothetical protein
MAIKLNCRSKKDPYCMRLHGFEPHEWQFPEKSSRKRIFKEEIVHVAARVSLHSKLVIVHKGLVKFACSKSSASRRFVFRTIFLTILFLKKYLCFNWKGSTYQHCWVRKMSILSKDSIHWMRLRRINRMPSPSADLLVNADSKHPLGAGC